MASKEPQVAIEMLARHTGVETLVIRVRVWEMLAELASQKNHMPLVLIEEAAEGLRGQGRENSRLRVELGRFLGACKDVLGIELPDDIALPASTQVFWHDFLGTS